MLAEFVWVVPPGVLERLRGLELWQEPTSGMETRERR
jgi:hypothetical protein